MKASAAGSADQTLPGSEFPLKGFRVPLRVPFKGVWGSLKGSFKGVWGSLKGSFKGSLFR